MDLSKGMGEFQKQGMGMGTFQKGKSVGHESDSITNTIFDDNAYWDASSFLKQVKGMGECQNQSQGMGMAVGQSQSQYHERVEDNAYGHSSLFQSKRQYHERVEDNAYGHSSSFQKQVTGMGEFQKQVAVDQERVDDNVYYHASSHISSFDDFSCLSRYQALDFYDMRLEKFSLSGDEALDFYDMPLDKFSLFGDKLHDLSHEIPPDEFNLLGDGGTVEENNEYDNPMGVSSMPESGQKCEVPLISTLLSPSGSHADSNNEPIAKRSRTVCGYTIEDVNRFHSPKLSVSSLSSNSLIGSKENVAQDNISPVAHGNLSDLNLSSPKLYVSSLSASMVGRENLQNNISPVITGFQCDFNLSSPKLSVSSLSSSLISPRANGFQSDKMQHQFQLYNKSTNGLSVEPRTIAARDRRWTVQQKIRSLEKLVPFKSKLDTGTMLKEVSRYVKFLQEQLRVLELMPSVLSPTNGLEKSRTLNPSSKILHSTSSAGKGIALNSNPKVEEQNLSAKEMHHILVTSRAVQRILFSEEKCVGRLQQYQMESAAEGFNNLFP